MLGKAPLNQIELSNLTTTMFSAAMGNSSWSHFLADLSAISGDICTHIFGYDTEAGVTMDLLAHGYDPEFLKTYDQHFASLNAWADGFSKHPAGTVVDCERMCTTQNLVKTEFYHDWLRPQEDIIQGGGALLFKNDTRVFALGGNIRLKDSEKLKSNWLAIVGQLIPHMQQAFEITRALEGKRIDAEVIANEGLKSVPGIILLSEMGRIVFANNVAQQMLADGAPVAFDNHNHLTYGSADSQTICDVASLRGALNLSSPSFSDRVTDSRTAKNYDLRFVKLSPDAGVAFPFDTMLGVHSHCTMLIITEAKRPSTTETLKESYALTPAEVAVAMSLAQGFSSSEIADQRQASIHTVRHQIKAAMDKLSVHRQSELVLKVLNLEP
ncbi:LuxR family transcriptional regulator [Cognatishimia sp. WU-CL00825]|uniref:helix-turn-helix transcriptional regulator n=1 Tax=Cognatishimia sp. WU-CL00825 TaxID=3127658 RepID=UPI00310324DB